MATTIVFNHKEVLQDSNLTAIDKIKAIATKLNGATFQFVTSGDASLCDTSIKVFYRPNYLFWADKSNCPSEYVGKIDESDMLNVISLFDYNNKWSKGIDILFVDPFFIK